MIMAKHSTLTISLLGAFQIAVGGREVESFNHARLQELAAYLLVQCGAPVSRQHLAFLLWPDSTEKQARTNLRNLWHRLRRALPQAERMLHADALTLQWCSDPECWVDVALFESCLDNADQASEAEAKIAHLERAVALYRGDLLPGNYSDWLLAERERLAQAYGEALDLLASLHEERCDYGRAIGCVQALLRHDPLTEPAYARLMRLYALNNDRAAALHVFHTCVTVLRRELDVEPDHATQALYEQLLNPASITVAPRIESVTPLVGRRSEWMQLQDAWRKARHRPQLALISGEAGIGKTRLAEALAEWVERQGAPVLIAHCHAAGGDLAYAPVTTWLRHRPPPPLANGWLRELARLLPELLAEHPGLSPPAPLTEAWQRLHLFEAVAHALLNNRTSLLLVLDDIQWCDRETLDWLLHLLRFRSPQPSQHPQLMVVATARNEDVTPKAAFSGWKANLVRTNQPLELKLEPLDQDATAQLAQHITGQSINPQQMHLLYRESEGIPLFVVEMVRAGFAATPDATPSLPDRVRHTLEARLAQLSAQARAVIELASVIGREFTYDVLAHTAILDEATLVNSLDECWRRRIIREQEGGAYDFSHDKLREVAYSGLSRTRRRWLHGQVACALKTLHDDDLDSAAGAMAMHYEAAGQSNQAIPFYQRAAAAARAVYAHAAAVEALQKAIDLMPSLPAGAIRDEQTAQLYESLGDVYRWLAQHELACSAYDTALASAVQKINSIDHARLQRKIGNTLAERRAGYDEAAAPYKAAEALLGVPAESERASNWWHEWCQLQLDQLMLRYWHGRLDDMAELLAHVRPLLERHGTALQRASFFSNLSRYENRRHRFAPSDIALEYANAALAALPSSGASEVRGSYQFGVAFNLLWRGDYAEAEAVLCKTLALTEETRDISLQARCLAYLMVIHRRQGRVDEVEATARRCLAVADSAGILDYIGASHAGLAWVAWRRGNLADTERRARLALAAWRKYTAPYPLYWQALWPLIGVMLAQGRIVDAIPHAHMLCAPEQQALPAALAEPLSAALAAWDAGRPNDAREKLQNAVDRAQDQNLS